MATKKQKRAAALARREAFMQEEKARGLAAQQAARDFVDEDLRKIKAYADEFNAYSRALFSGKFKGSFDEYRVWAKKQEDANGVQSTEEV